MSLTYRCYQTPSVELTEQGYSMIGPVRHPCSPGPDSRRSVDGSVRGDPFDDTGVDILPSGLCDCDCHHGVVRRHSLFV